MRNKQYVRAWAISQRSGLKFPYNEMVREPGTNLLIHKNESDGEFNAATDLLTPNLKWMQWGDPYPIEPTRPDISHVVDLFLEDDLGNTISDDIDNGVEVLG